MDGLFCYFVGFLDWKALNYVQRWIGLESLEGRAFVLLSKVRFFTVR